MELVVLLLVRLPRGLQGPVRTEQDDGREEAVDEVTEEKPAVGSVEEEVRVDEVDVEEDHADVERLLEEEQEPLTPQEGALVVAHQLLPAVVVVCVRLLGVPVPTSKGPLSLCLPVWFEGSYGEAGTRGVVGVGESRPIPESRGWVG